MPLQVPLINGEYPDWASTEIILVGKPRILGGFKAINYSHNLEPGEIRGNGSPQLIGRTLGEYKAEGDMELYLPQDKQLLDALGDGYMAVSFDIIVAYRLPNQSTPTRDEILGCRLTSGESNLTQGTDGLARKRKLHVMLLRENGRDPFPNAQR